MTLGGALYELYQMEKNPDLPVYLRGTVTKIIETMKMDCAEVRHGIWKRHYSRPGVYADLYWHCSICNGSFGDQYANKFKYCPDCGAKMRDVT